MNNKKYDKLDELISKSIKIEARKYEPSEDLNNILKNKIYKEEENQKIFAIYFWYLPMIFNTLIFISFALICKMLIHNEFILSISYFSCIYFIISGIMLTIIGKKKYNLKESMVIYIKKEA